MDTNGKKSRNQLSRREFLVLAGVGAAACSIVPGKAFASDQNPVLFTEDVASSLASEFAVNNFPGQNIYPGDVTRLYSNDLTPFGYIVDYLTASGENSGYVVFDALNNGMIYEFSIGEGVVSPYARSKDTDGISLYSDDQLIAVLESTFNYAAYSPTDLKAVDMYGQDVSDSISPISVMATPNTGDWNDIFITLSKGWTFKSQNYAPQEFVAFKESEVEKACGRYACAVSAMLNCAPHYIGSKKFPWKDIGSEYLDLWSKSSTKVLYTKNGISYGTTANAKIGPAFSSYCSSKGVSVSSSFVNSPSFSTFKNAIDRGDMAIFACGINQSGERSGHAILKNGSISEDIYTLVVADGWGVTARYLSFYYTRFTDTHGVYFKK